MAKRILNCSDCPLSGVPIDDLCEQYCSSMADFIDEARAEVIEEALMLCTYSRQLNDEEYDKGFEDGVALVRRRLRQMRVTLVQKKD